MCVKQKKMKHLVIALVVFLLVSCGTPTSQFNYSFDPAAITLTIGSNETLLLTNKSGNTQFFADLYSYSITAEATQVGDTASTVIVILQECTDFNDDYWYELERDTVATGSVIRLHGGSNTSLGYVKGEKLRLLIDDVGGSGADTTSLKIYATIKQS